MGGHYSAHNVVYVKNTLKEDGGRKSKKAVESGRPLEAGTMGPGRNNEWTGMRRFREDGCLGLGTDGCWKCWEGRNQR